MTDRHGHRSHPRDEDDPHLHRTPADAMHCYHADHRPQRGEGYGEALQTAA
jgi:hypothetical protein